MRTGVIGGTFNPIHCAHLEIAREALKTCSLDRVIFLPAADPPHKCLAGSVPFSVRFRMAELAISGIRFFGLSDIESRRSGKSFTVDTLSCLKAEFPGDDLYFIIGSDSFLEIGTWHRYADIFSSVSLIVVHRPGAEVNDPPGALPVAIRGHFCYDADSGRLEHDSGHEVLFVPGRPMEISSSEVRAKAAAGSPLEGLVPPAVAAFIKEQGLYDT